MTTDQTAPLDTTATRITSAGALRVWLFALVGLVFAMVVVGGATRLTDSGLSITEWKPIVGIIPPLDDADWHDAFQKYQQIPEFHKVNKGMELQEFKVIFWWEWGHRFLGRMIGFAFLFPYLLFWMTGQIPNKLQPKLLLMLVLGGAQGALGWYMVKSGLVDRVDVSQYRLAAHLGLAVIIFGYILFVALNLGQQTVDDKNNSDKYPLSKPLMTSSAIIVGLVFLQILAGAFVAGLDAGLSHNTWPLMDGQLVPEGLFVMVPWYANLFENVMTVQFNHRIFAYFVLTWIVIHGVIVLYRYSLMPIRASAAVLLAAILLQVIVGIWTLLAAVPISLGLVHQAGAMIVFAFAIYHFCVILNLYKNKQFKSS